MDIIFDIFTSDEEDMTYSYTPQFGDLALTQMYKFYQEGQFCDFSIKVEGRVYKVRSRADSLYPQLLKKLRGDIALGLSIRPLCVFSKK